MAQAKTVATQWLSLTDDNLVGVRQAAELLNASQFSVRRWLSQGRLRGCRVAGRIKMRQSEVLRFIKSYEVNDAQDVSVLRV